MTQFLVKPLAATIVLVAASLGFAAGGLAADGSTRPDDRAIHGPGAIAVEAATDLARPDDRATHGPGSVATITVTPTLVQASAEPSFDWVDAGVGAAAMVGLGLLVAGASIVALRRRRAPGGLDDQAMPTAP